MREGRCHPGEERRGAGTEEPVLTGISPPPQAYLAPLSNTMGTFSLSSRWASVDRALGSLHTKVRGQVRATNRGIDGGN